jgi:hypothetical protein
MDLFYRDTMDGRLCFSEALEDRERSLSDSRRQPRLLDQARNFRQVPMMRVRGRGDFDSDVRRRQPAAADHLGAQFHSREF